MMRKIIVLAVVAIMATLNASAQTDAVQPYIELDQLPKLINIMPAPPAFDSPEFANDVVRYCWGKQQRQDPDRVASSLKTSIRSSENN